VAIIPIARDADETVMVPADASALDLVAAHDALLARVRLDPRLSRKGLIAALHAIAQARQELARALHGCTVLVVGKTRRARHEVVEMLRRCGATIAHGLSEGVDALLVGSGGEGDAARLNAPPGLLMIDEEELARIFEVRVASDEQLRRVVAPAAERARARALEAARQERSSKHAPQVQRPRTPSSELEDFARKHVREGCTCSICRARDGDGRDHAMATRPAA
jgi:hypothetical protein